MWTLLPKAVRACIYHVFASPGYGIGYIFCTKKRAEGGSCRKSFYMTPVAGDGIL